MLRHPSVIIAIVIAGYFALPTISNFVSNVIFQTKPAPWESVVGLYFPDGARGNAIQSPEFSALSQCKNWAAGMHAMHNSYTAATNSESICGWGIVRANKATGLPKMRDFIQIDTD